MAEETWAKLLHAIYTGQQTGDTDLPAKDSTTHEQALGFLQRHGLIEEQDGDYILTEKGFEVARQREMERSQFEMNFFLAAFTFILSLAIVFQTGYQLIQVGRPGTIAAAGLIAVTVLMLLLLERRTDFLRLLVQGR